MSPFWRRHADRRGFLHARARIVAAIRGWFADQGFIEVEPGLIVPSPGAELHLQAVEAGGRYLHTSPEFAMKKLLAAGEEKIFYLGKVWRAGEEGPLHASEFTMLEWYRAGAPYERVMQDCIALTRLAANEVGASKFSWRERVCDPFAEAQILTVREAFACFASPRAGEVAAQRPEGGSEEPAASFDAARNPDGPPPPTPAPPGGGGSEAFSRAIVQIEPHLGSPALTLLTEYPISEAALARPAPHDPSVAERFELYACGVELANGFGELTDPVEQRVRLEAAMAEKEKLYGARWPIDEDFLAALAHMPPSSGVALGLDRLVMLATGARTIQDVLWTPN
ncbi:MAG TPA: EF-P lysine aminoacylase EpmA [Caulobacterales bacterium]|nr:EF-P lysine aminoacylase EpmA [Caulobacterales bacterium]